MYRNLQKVAVSLQHQPTHPSRGWCLFPLLQSSAAALPAAFAVTPRWMSGPELLARRGIGEQRLTRLWFIGHGLLQAKTLSPTRLAHQLPATFTSAIGALTV
jgi:hypothetical protein